MSTVTLTDENFDSLTREGTVLIDFWGAWCGPCQTFGPVYEQASERYPDVLFGKVDVEDNPALAERFAIRGIPTLVAMQDGSTLVTLPGALSAPDLDELAAELSGDVEAPREKKSSVA